MSNAPISNDNATPPSDETTVIVAANADADAPVSETPEKDKVVPAHVALNVDLKERLASCGGQVRTAIVEALAKDEIERRTRVGEAAVRLETALSKEFEKIKPDVTNYTDPTDEKSAVTSWSPEQAKKKKESAKKLEELRSAINKAFDKWTKDDWDKLEQKVEALKKEQGQAANDGKKK